MQNLSNLRQIQDCKGRVTRIIGNDAILKLANENSCPNYRIINPLTKEETIWFISSEIEDWLTSQYVTYNEGLDCFKYDFRFFTKEDCRATSDVPEELYGLSELLELKTENFNTPSGIYFLCKDKKINYIGQAVNVAKRIVTHIDQGAIPFDRVYYIICPLTKLVELEGALIRHYRPPYNNSHKSPVTRKDFLILDQL